MKNILLSIGFITCFNNVALAEAPEFSIHNKSDKDIRVFVNPGQGEELMSFTVGAGKFHDIQKLDDINYNKFVIYSGDINKLFYAKIESGNTPFKTIYLNWN